MSLVAPLKKSKGRRPHAKTRTGCETCKRRHVKCDEARPHCRKCVSSGRKCEGYNPPKAWLFESESKSEEEHSESSPEENKSESPPHKPSSKVVTEQASTAVVVTQSTPKPIADQNPTPFKSFRIDWKAIYRDPLFGHLINRFVHSKQSALTGANHSMTANWAVIGANTADSAGKEFLTKALMSISMVLISKTERNDELYPLAVKAYQDALPELRRAIMQLSKAQSASLRKDIIAACQACALGEFMMGSWVNADRHLDGITVLVHLGGPDLLQDSFMRQLIFDHRAIWVTCSYIQRAPTIYCRLEWAKAIAMCDDPIALGVLQKVCAIAFNFLPMLREFDMSKDNATISHLLHFLSRVKQHEAAFVRYRFDNRLPSRSLLPPNFDAAPESRKLWLTELERGGLEVATSISYWASFMIYLNMLILDIAEKLENHGRDASAIAKKAKAAIFSLVNEIFHTLVYGLNGTHSLESCYHVLFSLDTAWLGCTAAGNTTPELLSTFKNFSDGLKSTGFDPFREPWEEAFSQLSISDQPLEPLMTFPNVSAHNLKPL